MAKTEPFDNYLPEYEQWFVDHYFAFRSEVEAIRKVMPEKGRSVEIGVGSGIFAYALGIEQGCDPSYSMRMKARERGINATDCIAENLPYKNETFDMALMVTTICFVDDVNKSFSEIYRILRPGGKLILGYVNKTSQVGKGYYRERNKSLFYKDAIFFATEEIKDLLIKHGFSIREYYQTIFGSLESVTSIQPPKKGCDEGSFIVVNADKIASQEKK